MKPGYRNRVVLDSESPFPEVTRVMIKTPIGWLPGTADWTERKIGGVIVHASMDGGGSAAAWTHLGKLRRMSALEALAYAA